MNPIGWREGSTTEPTDPALIESLRGLQVALLSDNMARAKGAYGIVARSRQSELVGPALTVRTRSGDNLAIYRAFRHCRPGDVLVIDGGGVLDQALMGEIMITYARSIGVAGIVIDGAIRDMAAIKEMDFPVHARGVTHRGPYKNGPGELNVTISVGGMVVNPGDLIVADDDGVIAVPRADVMEVAADARKQRTAEAEKLAAIGTGTYDLSWIDETMRKLIGPS